MRILCALILTLTLVYPALAAEDDPGYFALPGVAQQAQPGEKTSGGGSSMVVEPQPSGGASGAGFADSPWKATYSQVKTRLKSLATAQTAAERVEILMEVRNEYILVRRNDVLYRYSFYKTPYDTARLTNHELKKEEKDAEEALLYHVKVSTPFIDSALIKKKLEASNGTSTRSTVDKTMRGVDIWEVGSGLIFQWVEPYNGKPFTRTIDYISTEMAKQIMKEQTDYFDAKEKYILKFLLVK